MKKYVILGNFLGKDTVGLTRLGYEYLLQIDKFANEFDMELLIPMNFRQFVPHLENIKITEYGKLTSGWTTKYATKYARKNRRTVINLTSPFCLNKGSIVEIADVRYLEKIDKKYFDDFNFRYKMFLRAFCGTIFSKYITTISSFSQNRIHELLHVPLSKIKIIPCGWDHYKNIVSDDNIFDKHPNIVKGNYFFTLGSLARHKNHGLIVKLAKQNPNNVFVIAGGIDPGIFYKDCAIDNTENVIFTGRITDEEVKALMTNCKAFIFPSLYEGFGIPPMEAMSCGAKVILSDIPVLREIFKESAYYIDANDSTVDLNALLENKVKDPSVILNEYTWDKAGECWHELLKEFEKE